jgi:hypothetical protein
MSFKEPSDVTSEDLLELIKGGGASSVERRPRLPSDNEVAKIMAAFANTEGGFLIIGADEQGDVCALSGHEVSEVIGSLERIARAVLFSPVYINAVKLGTHWAVYARVEKEPSFLSPVRTASGEVYKRIDSEIEVMPEHGIDVMPTPSVGGEVRVFVAMSFREEEEPSLVDYFQAMKRAADQSNLPLSLVRIDRVEGDFEISQKILDEIDKSDAVIADFTSTPRNVYFELGYARGKGKHVLQVARKETGLEFDVRNWRTIFYKNATELEAALSSALRRLYEVVVNARAE